MSAFTTFPIPNINIPALPDVSPVTDASQFIMERAGTGRVAATALRDYIAGYVATGAAATVAAAANSVGRNLLHNPLFNVAQRGAGPFTTAVYTLDRWLLDSSLDTNSVVPTVLTDANRTAIGDEAAIYGWNDNYTGNAGASAYTRVLQRVEGMRRLAGKTVTVSFWAWCGAGAPKIGVSYDQSFGTGGSPSASVIGNGQAVTISTTPTRYSVTIAIPSASGKVLGTNGDDYTALSFWLSAGATQNVRAGSIGVQSANVALWGMQAEIGTVATPLEKPDPQQDLAKCLRYTQPIVVSVRGYASGAGQHVVCTVSFQPMRASPTAVVTTGGTSSNISSAPFAIMSSNSAQHEVISVAAGDCYAVNVGYLLSADL